MKPGRELDALIAEKAMGMRVADWVTGETHAVTSGIAALRLSEFQQNRIPHYSTDIKAAWEVLDKLRTKFKVRFEMDPDLCELRSKTTKEIVHCENGFTIMHAICLAALKGFQD